jgi:hypothetical protein
MVAYDAEELHIEMQQLKMEYERAVANKSSVNIKRIGRDIDQLQPALAFIEQVVAKQRADNDGQVSTEDRSMYATPMPMAEDEPALAEANLNPALMSMQDDDDDEADEIDWPSPPTTQVCAYMNVSAGCVLWSQQMMYSMGSPLLACMCRSWFRCRMGAFCLATAAFFKMMLWRQWQS